MQGLAVRSHPGTHHAQATGREKATDRGLELGGGGDERSAAVSPVLGRKRKEENPVICRSCPESRVLERKAKESVDILLELLPCCRQK